MRGELRTGTGDLPGAERDLELALARARQLGENETLGWAHEMRSDLSRWLADPEGALAHARQAVQIAERLGSAFSQTSSYGTLALAHRLRGEWTEAADACAHVLDIIRTRRSFWHWEAVTLAQLADVQAMRGDTAVALDGARTALALARRRRTRFVELIASLTVVRVLALDQGAAACGAGSAMLAYAETLVQDTGAASWAPLVHCERARLARLGGDEDAYRRELDVARAGFLAIGAAALAQAAADGIVPQL
jgi:tetratricopeptide (TPR) repeat protein